MKLSPIADCNFGREVLDWAPDAADVHLLEALHEHGILLFRNVRGISSNELAERVNAWFPALEINGPSANRPSDGGPVSVLGSTKDEQGRFNADYVPAATTGAPLLSADGGWDSPLSSSSWPRSGTSPSSTSGHLTTRTTTSGPERSASPRTSPASGFCR